MTTVSVNEAVETLPKLLRATAEGPVVIRDGDHDVAVLVNSDAWDERVQRFARLEQSRDRVVRELTRRLEAADIRYVDFVDEILNEL
jgi:PHD/YefM family antitoxin component YafN of YafNO toxin-antitoxin module